MNTQFISKLIESKILGIHTGYLAAVLSVSGDYAVVQPLTYSRDTSGETVKQPTVRAYVPQNVKYEVRKIKYRITSDDYETAEVLVPAPLEENDIVYCGVCERDISAAISGQSENPTRHHNINDSVILKVL